jgi:hypothetical protein
MSQDWSLRGSQVFAAYHRVWVVRGMKVGITATIDPTGKVISKLPSGAPGVLAFPESFVLVSKMRVYTAGGSDESPARGFTRSNLQVPVGSKECHHAQLVELTFVSEERAPVGY